MFSISMEDVYKMLETMRGQLIALGVILALAIIITVAVNKKTIKNTAARKLIHSQSWIIAAVGVILSVSMILFGPLYSTLNLMSGSGKLTQPTIKAAKQLAENIEDEGIVLLKNENNSLPLKSHKLNVFGWASTNPIYGGSGSGSMNDSYPTVSLLEGLKNAGFETNTVLSDFYTKYRADRPTAGMTGADWSLPEPTADSYADSMITDAQEFSDEALLVLGRPGGEGNDLPHDMSAVKTLKPGEKMEMSPMGPIGANYQNNSKDYNDFEKGKGYLDLSQTEENLVKLVTSKFNKVTVVYNGANTLNLGFVDEYPQIQSVLWTPPAGQTGFNSLGKVLSGSVNPSGKTTDTFLKDFSKAPWFNNIGAFSYTNTDDLAVESLGGEVTSTFVNYVEGIYVGYRFFETAAAEGALDYNSTVQYPFGYGLSYTTFNQKMGEVNYSNGSISFDVTVTNTGSVAGKTPVQIYYNPPYANGGIEKSVANLVAFAKTKELKPGESEIVPITFNESDMASYDQSGEGAYKLEAGDYEISVNENSHVKIASQSVNVSSTITYDESNPRPTDKQAAHNEFAEADGDGTVTYLSRANSFANYAESTAAPTNFELPEKYKSEMIAQKNYSDDKYFSKTEYTGEMPTTGAKNGVQLYQLYGKDYDDKLWDKLLDGLTVDQMRDLISLAGFNTIAIDSIGKVRQSDIDGPAALNNNFTKQGSIGFPASVTVANTWNKDLATQYGDLIGTMAVEMHVTGWYAPGLNTHRSPYGGRNFEYFSEDGLLGGTMAAAQVAAAKKHGIYSFMKHFALNDQETNRNNLLHTWSNEQAIREIYLKPFEYGVKDGGATAMMSSFNFIGNDWSGSTAPLLRTVLRGEWGFRGMVETDYAGVAFMIGNRAILNGNDAMLATMATYNMVTNTDNPKIVQAMREASHNILYTTVNSWVYKDGAPKAEIAAWQWIYWAVIVVATVLLIGAEWLAIVRFMKRRKA
ncbi:glycoside hydrolase family 3 C-terminal domain-containing protein [Alloscardovia omnicolens]|uniref:glycoside hydrolase family 3 C-terminal domain-containing protein n=1 Tax=Alloscardovia omnicolens TaxID=419015 RepID=UPI00288C3E5A|nr:glycoside hydrolase family 3 C-terminal domain-containing protein [Alloscardovia omnicolens]